MTSNFFKQARNTAKEAAIKSARQMQREPLEILKSGKSQITGKPESGESQMSVMQQVMTGDGKVGPLSSQQELSINAMAKRRLSEIEAELRQLRMQREQKSYDWAKEQQQLLGGGQEKRPQAVQEPSSRHARGMMGPGKKKGGTKEMGKQHAG